MDTLDRESLTGMTAYYTGLMIPCPSRVCKGNLTEVNIERMDPFKAFLMCPECESRLRLFKKDWKR